MERATLQFLKDLKANNNREWFGDNRDRYQAAVADFQEHVAGLITATRKLDPAIGPVTPKEAIFRIFRDVRFGKDKSPYKPNFGAFIARGGRKGGRAGYYLHLEGGGNSMIAGGIYMPPTPVLTQLRQGIAADEQTLRKIIKRAAFQKAFGTFHGEQLKTMPRGFPKDHSAGDLLRFKSYIVSHKLSDSHVLAKDFIRKTLADFKLLLPLTEYLNAQLSD